MSIQLRGQTQDGGRIVELLFELVSPQPSSFILFVLVAVLVGQKAAFRRRNHFDTILVVLPRRRRGQPRQRLQRGQSLFGGEPRSEAAVLVFDLFGVFRRQWRRVLRVSGGAMTG